MLRVLLHVLAVLAAVLPVIGGVLASAAVGSQSRVYSVAKLSQLMIDDPRALADRVVLVRGVVDANVLIVLQDASGTTASAFALEDATTGAYGVAPFIALGYGHEDAVWATLRRLPIVGALAPAPQRVVYNRPATYRVRVETLAGSCRIACSVWLVLTDGAAP